jgi:outer membrane immunogenic protein
MKRLLLASVSMIAIIAASPGQAKDRPRPAQAMPFNWTGCYIGGHAGYGWGSKTFTDNMPGYLVSPFGGAVAPSVSDGINGILGGGQLGCNYQISANWVLGLEGEISAADISGGVTSPYPDNPAFHAKTDWIGAVTGRFGYAWDHALIYVKGGAAWAEDQYSYGSSYLGSYSASETRGGWTIGAGLEWAFANDWSAKIEYDYYDFGSRDLIFAYGGGAVVSYGPQLENVKQQIEAIKIGINYRFWTSAVP